MKFITRILITLVFFTPLVSHSIHQCEINFVKYVNGQMPKDLKRNPMLNLWDEKFNPNLFIPKFKEMELPDRIALVEELTKLVHKDIFYARNLAILSTFLKKDGLIPVTELQRIFLKRKFDHMTFYYSRSTKDLSVQLFFDPEKYNYLKRKMKTLNLDDFYRKEYTIAILQSNRKVSDIEIAFEHNMTLRQDPKSLKQFKAYLEFLDNAEKHVVKSGMKKIENIYNFDHVHSKLSLDSFHSPDKHFLNQQSRLKSFEKRRYNELQKTYKLLENNKLNEALDKIREQEARGIFVRLAEKLRFKRKVEELELVESLRKRAKMQAKHEKHIYRKLLNGCNGGGSPRLESAKKKFSTFKFGLALGIAPVMYVAKNQDKMETDPYFWEKIGHEMFMSLLFTYVGNKLFTDTSTTFMTKYLEGYLKFGVLSYAEAYSYEELFGRKSLIRHFQRLYKPNVPESELDLEFKKLKNSPTFEKDVKELYTFLEKQSKLKNTKNFLNKYFNLNTYDSKNEKFKITREDLETEEAREMMMELLAERLYLQGMGDWAIFQTGRKDWDRFAFYRARNLIWDLKGLALNLAIFEIMCREPFGKIGSWTTILSLVIGDQLITGDITYGYRREAINQ